MARSEDQQLVDALSDALAKVSHLARDPLIKPVVIRRLRAALATHATALELARSQSDPILTPQTSFDPSDPKTVGRMVSIALLAQPMIPLKDVKPAYGSGVYAIYYRGEHPLYKKISKTETPIYVGKADPDSGDASTVREQGTRLTARLLEHAGTIKTAEGYAAHLTSPLFPIRLDEFWCRRLVCATNAQLVAEKHLIGTFRPLWNMETQACWGMSKHGDSAKTRANKRSPWDVAHPGRPWALESKESALTLEQIETRINETLEEVPPRRDHAALMEELLVAFRQYSPPNPQASNSDDSNISS